MARKSSRATRFEVYDKVSWHYPDGKNCRSLASDDITTEANQILKNIMANG